MPPAKKMQKIETVDRDRNTEIQVQTRWAESARNLTRYAIPGTSK